MKESYKTYHNVHEWTVDDVKKWLKEKKFDNNVSNLFYQHRIDGKTLLTLREDDLRIPPLQMNCLGDIKKVYLLINQLQTINVKFYSQIPNNPFIDINNVNYVQLKKQIKDDLKKDNNLLSNRKKFQSNNEDQETDFSTVPDEISEINEDDDFKLLKLPNGKYQEFKPEAWKALVAMVYFFIVTWITAIVMVIVHDRVPDMQTYPPLPDIFLDNVPLIPWAFAMCELCCLILFMILSTVLVFHKHRFIVIRRIFSLFGTVFLLRCFTMLITSLSVPGRHLQCKARSYGQWVDRLKEAYLIWQGVGMSIQGVRTCGDYMFSGHAVTLTLLNFFITEYTPRNLYPVHTLSWVLNLFGFFFILAGHEHYSIDVFIAFYISNRIFLYYHTLANNRALYQGDRRRTRIWFPLFYLFESGVNGIIPNIFELPFKNLFLKLKNTNWENSEKENNFDNLNASFNKKEFQNVKPKENDLNESNYSSSKSSRGSKRKNKKKS